MEVVAVGFWGFFGFMEDGRGILRGIFFVFGIGV